MAWRVCLPCRSIDCFVRKTGLGRLRLSCAGGRRRGEGPTMCQNAAAKFAHITFVFCEFSNSYSVYFNNEDASLICLVVVILCEIASFLPPSPTMKIETSNSPTTINIYHILSSTGAAVRVTIGPDLE